MMARLATLVIVHVPCTFVRVVVGSPPDGGLFLRFESLANTVRTGEP